MEITPFDLPADLQAHNQLVQQQNALQEQNALRQAVPMLASDPQNAFNTAAKTSPNAALKLLPYMKDMRDEQKAQLADRAGALGQLAYTLKTQYSDPVIRKAVAQSQASTLAAHGVTPDQIANFDYSDNNLQSFINNSQSVQQLVAQSNSDRTYQAGRTDHADTVTFQNKNLAREDAQLAETRRHNQVDENKPINAPFGSTLINPKTGQTVYQSKPDDTAIEQMVDWSIAHGGQVPPNARSPAIQEAFNTALSKRLQATGQTNDDLVNKNIAIAGRRGAAVQTAKQQAGTQINEDTVTGGMDILEGLLKKGAAGPTGITDLNNLDLWARQHTSDPDAANLVNAIGAISNEYARVMTGTTGGTPSSDSARNEAATRLLKGYSANTMRSVMGQMHYEMRQRSSAQRGALGQLTGGTYSGVDSSIPLQPQGDAPPSSARWSNFKVHNN